ncbi:conserved hypothetical protein [metagenome]|uniref:DUF4192 domain-containing protein n=1 Tax=metagenome TaxID=256318 RepID=A0A2P2BWI3_9ZZZZ
MTTPKTLRASRPEDLLAAVPVVLGFHPERSIVMLTFGAPGTGFHARTDLPGRAELAEAITPLLEAATRHRVARVAFVLYSDDASRAAFAARQLRQAFRRAGIDVVTVLRADGRRWFEVDPRVAPGRGRAYDVAEHPFTAQSVYEGSVTHRDRATLAASLEPVPARVAAVTRALPDALAALADLDVDREARWLSGVLLQRGQQSRPSELDDAEVARLLVAVAVDPIRDLAWLAIRRATAGVQVTLWADVLQRSPEELAASPAWLLAFAAWQEGHGALAWCALDRCLEADPDYSLAELLGSVLVQALPPSAWEEFLDDQVAQGDEFDCESFRGR